MGIFKIIAGAALIAVGIVVGIFVNPYLGAMIAAAGAGMVLSGVGTLLQPGVFDGATSTTRHPTAPRPYCYGRVRTGGILVYENTWGQSDQYLDMVMVLATHPCEMGLPGEGINQVFPQLYFDGQRITLNTSQCPAGAVPGSGTSYSPVQTTANITSITRSSNQANGTGGGVVTVVMSKAIPYLQAGDNIKIQNISADRTLNGTFQVQQVITQSSPGFTTSFTYLSGGNPAIINNEGQAVSVFADYGTNVYVEYLNGTQTLGQTFLNMGSTINDQNGNAIANPWTNYFSLEGCTAAFLRIKYVQKYFPQGIPQFSFLFRGNNQIYDPRLGSEYLSGTTINPASHAYSENAALCIADYLTGDYELYGFGYDYVPAGSTQPGVPLDMLTTQANLCDQLVHLALPIGGTEPAYACNGHFDLSMNRGEVLKNLLTSCAGRISESEGQVYLNVAQWNDALQIPSVDLFSMAAGPITWSPACEPRDLINGVRGTFISPQALWQPSDFPPYAQDAIHGYDVANQYPQYGGDINLAADNGERRWGNIQLPFTISYATAQRLAKIELLRKRWYGTGQCKLNLSGYQFLPFDIISPSFPYLGWNADSILEIPSTRLTFNKVKVGDADVMLLGTEIDIQETDSSIYQWSTEEQLTPNGTQSSNWFAQNYTETTPFPWSPGYASPLAGDAIGGAATFGLQVVYSGDAQGNAITTLQIKGTPPLTPDLDLAGPELQATAVSGGSFDAGWYAVALSSFDNGEVTTQQQTEFLDIINVYVPQGGSISVTALWGSGDDGGALYIAQTGTEAPDSVYSAQAGGSSGNGSNAVTTTGAYTFHFQTNLAPGNNLGATNATITSFNQSTPGGPDPMFDRFGINLQEEIHSGPWAQQVISVTSNTVTIGAPGFTANQWSGYTLSLLSRAQYLPGSTTSSLNPEQIVVNMPVESNTATNGSNEVTFIIGPNDSGQQLPDLTTLLNPNDLITARSRFTFTANSMSDPNIANGIYPNGATGVETGHLAVVLSGADTGDVVPISGVSQDSNGKYTIFNLAGNWAITPQTGDIVVIVDPTPVPGWTGPSINLANNSAGPSTIAKLTVQNLANQTWLVTVFTENTGGTQSLAQFSPMRDFYVAGNQGTRTIYSSTTMVPSDGIVQADCTAGNITFTLLPFSSIPNQELRITKIDTSTNTCTVACQGSDTINGASTAVLITQDDFALVTVPGASTNSGSES